MAIIRTIAVSLLARSDQYNKALTDSESVTRRFRDEIKKTQQATKDFELKAPTFKGLSAAAVGIRSALPVAALGYVVTAGNQAAENVHRLSQRLGITTEALTALRFAGSRFGIEATEMDRTMERLAKSLGKATNEGSEQARVLQQLRLGGGAFTGLSLDETFLRIADAISRLPDPTARLQAAMSLFEEGGGKMLDLLNQGRDGITGLMDEASTLGATLSASQAKAGADAVASIRNVRSALAGLRDDVATEVAPLISGMAGDLSKFMGELNRMSRGAAGDEGPSIGQRIEGARKAVVETLAKDMAGQLFTRGMTTGERAQADPGIQYDIQQANQRFRQRVRAQQERDRFTVGPLERRGEGRGLGPIFPTGQLSPREQGQRWAVNLAEGINRMVGLLERLVSTTDRGVGIPQ